MAQIIIRKLFALLLQLRSFIHTHSEVFSVNVIFQHTNFRSVDSVNKKAKKIDGSKTLSEKLDFSLGHKTSDFSQMTLYVSYRKWCLFFFGSTKGSNINLSLRNKFLTLTVRWDKRWKIFLVLVQFAKLIG